MFLSSKCHFEFSTLDSDFSLFMIRSSQIDLPSAHHLRRSQHKKWKVLIRVENFQWPLAGQKNTHKNVTKHEKCALANLFFQRRFNNWRSSMIGFLIGLPNPSKSFFSCILMILIGHWGLLHICDVVFIYKFHLLF